MTSKAKNVCAHCTGVASGCTFCGRQMAKTGVWRNLIGGGQKKTCWDLLLPVIHYEAWRLGWPSPGKCALGWPSLYLSNCGSYDKSE